MKTFDKLKEVLAAAEADVIKFEGKGNQAAGRRLRKLMMQTKVLAKEIRDEVTALKNQSSEA